MLYVIQWFVFSGHFVLAIRDSLVPEGPVAFYGINHANRPAGFIQDQPRGLFTDFLIIDHELSLYLGAGRGNVVLFPDINSVCQNRIARAKLDIFVSDK